MPRQFVIVVGLATVVIAVGCKRSALPTAKPSPPPAIAAKAPVSSMPAEEKAASDRAQEEKSAAADKPESTAPDVASEKKDEAPENEPPKSERVAILTPGGPLIVDVQLTIDGRPQTKAFDELIDRVLTAADTDKDGKATWKELVENKEYLASQQPASPQAQMPAPARQLKMWKDQYDRNRDGQLDRGEAASWLGRGAGRSAQAFALRSSRSYFSVPSAGSRIWKLLDANGDEQLSAAELDRCAATIASLDDNDDGIVVAEELASLREQLQVDGNQATTIDRGASPYAAMHVEPDFEIDRLEYLLSDLYAPQQDLGPKSFSALADVYRSLDANSDDWLDQDELAKLLTIKPHLKLTVDFRGADKAGKGSALLTASEHISDLTANARPGDDRMVLWLGRTRLVVSAHDLRAEKQPERADATGSQVRLMVHDECDALFEALDANADGRLGEREIATAAKRLSSGDANNDGQLSNDELPYSMIVAFLRGEAAGEQSFYQPPSAPASPALTDTPPWFVHADFNHDGDVSRREFLGSIEQFSLLDANRDDYIDAVEGKAAKTVFQ